MTIEPDDLKRPASLTLWSSDPDAPKAVEPRDYPTLKEALDEAGIAMNEDSATPWIITDSGLILSPAWLRGHLGEAAAETVRDPQRPEVRLSSALPALPDRKRPECRRRRVGLSPVVARVRGINPESAARS